MIYVKVNIDRDELWALDESQYNRLHTYVNFILGMNWWWEYI